MRLNREKKVNHEQVRIRIGTTNSACPKSMYLEFGFFVSPIYKKKSYISDMNSLRKAIKRCIDEFIKDSDLFDAKFISNFELSEGGLKPNKRSYTSIQVIFKQYRSEPIPLKEVYTYHYGDMMCLGSNIAKKFESLDYCVYKTKKS